MILTSAGTTFIQVAPVSSALLPRTMYYI